MGSIFWENGITDKDVAHRVRSDDCGGGVLQENYVIGTYPIK